MSIARCQLPRSTPKTSPCSPCYCRSSYWSSALVTQSSSAQVSEELGRSILRSGIGTASAARPCAAAQANLELQDLRSDPPLRTADVSQPIKSYAIGARYSELARCSRRLLLSCCFYLPPETVRSMLRPHSPFARELGRWPSVEWAIVTTRKRSTSIACAAAWHFASASVKTSAEVENEARRSQLVWPTKLLLIPALTRHVPRWLRAP